MGTNGFEKATSKMLGKLGSPVRIAQPVSEARPDRDERERMRREEEEKERGELERQRDEDRKRVLQDLVELNVIKAGGEGGDAGPSGPGTGQPAVTEEPEVREPARGRGRPPKNPEVEEYVGVTFRVTPDFRRRLRLMSAGQGRSATALFEEAFDLLFAKYGTE